MRWSLTKKKGLLLCNGPPLVSFILFSLGPAALPEGRDYETTLLTILRLTLGLPNLATQPPSRSRLSLILSQVCATRVVGLRQRL